MLWMIDYFQKSSYKVVVIHGRKVEAQTIEFRKARSRVCKYELVELISFLQVNIGDYCCIRSRCYILGIN